MLTQRCRSHQLPVSLIACERKSSARKAHQPAWQQWKSKASGVCAEAALQAQVQMEDDGLCAMVQRGLHSPGYGVGR